MAYHSITLTVNGVERRARIKASMLLVDLLRESFRLTGTNVGCDTTQCGCCTIHLDGEAIKSCTILAVQAANRSVTTIEGMSNQDGSMHPVQQAFQDCHGLQCGFCTPGMVMMLSDYLEKTPNASEAEIRHALEGNLCRCTGYQHIVDAALQVVGEQKDV